MPYARKTPEKVAADDDPQEAQRFLIMQIGDMKQARHRTRGKRLGARIESVLQDLCFAVRMLRKSPGFTAVIVLTLALGIGANTAIFTLVNAVLLQSIPVKHPEQLMVLQWSAHDPPNTSAMYNSGDCWAEPGIGTTSGCYLSSAMFKAIASARGLFANAAAFAGPAKLDLAGNGQASIVTGELVSGSFFETLGVRPAVGRMLIAADDQKGASPVVVLDYVYWQSAFAGNPGVVGRTIRLNNVLFTIVGVADQTFTRLTPGRLVNLYLPLTEGKALGLGWSHDLDDSASWWLTVVARLRPEVKRAEAEAAVSLMFRDVSTHGAKPAWKASDNPQIKLVAAQQGLVGYRAFLSKPLQLLMAAVTLVLLIACANIASLMLARSATREREMAVRLALGASRSRVIQQVLTESLLLSLSGAALGVVLAYAGASALATFTSANMIQHLQISVQLNAKVLLFTIGLALITGVVFGMAPALRGAHTRAATAFQRGAMGRLPSSRHEDRRWPKVGRSLVVVQVALSVVMLISAGLILRTLEKVRSVDAGFDTRNLILVWVNPTLAGYDMMRVKNYYDNLQQRLAALPGVASASYSSDALLDGNQQTSEITVDGETSKQTMDAQILMVGPHYFTTMRIPVLRGRPLNLADVRDGPPVAMVNEAFVESFLNGREPIGLQIGLGDKQQSTIVGVVQNTKYDSLTEEDKPIAYLPLKNGPAVFEVRTETTPATLIAAVRKTVHDLDENVPLMRVQTQSEAINQRLFNQRLLVRLLGGFAGLGVGLVCIGLYGLLSYEVVSRTQEIGVRIALGAQRNNVLWLFLRRGLIVVLLGSVIGVGSASLLVQLLISMLYGIKPLDPVTFIAVPILLFGIGLVACLLPATRVTRVEPAVALRYE